MAHYRSVKTFPLQLNIPLSHRDRGYKIVQLPNGILTLLISDPNKDVGCACICVASGSHNDPDNIPGLAHLCEHSLFLGTKEFPKFNSYHEMVSAYGGRTNAFTTGEQTCFHFEVPYINGNTNAIDKDCSAEINDEPIFDYVLRHFASFFKSPSFHHTRIRNEILLVNDEHIGNINSPVKILFQGLKILSNKNHPFSRFATGNINTLDKMPKLSSLNLFSEIFKYYKTNYIPRKMTLVIIGPQSLNHLQKLALSNFSNIQPKYNKEIIPEIGQIKHELSEFSILSEAWNKTYEEPVFTKCNLNKCIIIKNQNHSRLRITFPVNLRLFNKDYILYQNAWISLLGNESVGSLCAYLISLKNLATSVYMFAQSLTFQDEVLILDILLTEKGRKNMLKIIVALFQYINQVILNCSYKTMGHYLSELITVEQFNFIYKDVDDSSMSESVSLTKTLQKDLTTVIPENILKSFNYGSVKDIIYNGDYKEDPAWWRLMAAKFIVATMKTLSYNKCNILVLDSNLQIIKSFTNPDSRLTKLRDLYYDFEYVTSNMDLSLINEESSKLCPYFSFPKPNEYLVNTQNELLSLLKENPLDSVYTQLDYQPCFRFPISEPKLIDTSLNLEVWTKVDDKTMKIISSFRLHCMKLKPSPIVTIGIEILSELIGNKLRHEMYSGELVGYFWGLFPSIDSLPSITLTISGFPSNFNKFESSIVEEIQEAILNLEIIPYNTFSKAKESIRNYYENFLKFRGIERAISASSIFLEKGIWSIDQRLEALEKLDIEDLKSITMNLFCNKSYITVFIQHNTKFDEVNKICNTFQQLTSATMCFSKIFQNRKLFSYLMPEGKRYLYEDKVQNNETISTTFHYIQIGCREDSYERTLTKFIVHVFSIFAAAELRSKRKLGYLIDSGFRLFRKTLGVYISISSGSYDPYYLNSQVEDFLYELELMLYAFTNEEFEIKLKRQFIDSYMNLGTQNSKFAPSNELYAVKPSKSSSNFPNDSTHDMHKNFFEKIVNKTYRFGGLKGEDEIDILIISNLTKTKFLEFFRRKISIKSKSRSSLSLLFPSRLYQDDLKNKSLQWQLIEILRKDDISIGNADPDKKLRKLTLDGLQAKRNSIKCKNERNKPIKVTLKALKEKIEYLKPSNGNQEAEKNKKLSRHKVIKTLGDEYNTSIPVLKLTTLDNWKQLHSECDVVK